MIIRVIKKESGEENLLSVFEQWKEQEESRKLLNKEEISKLLNVFLKETNERANENNSYKEKSYEIPVIRLSDFEQWKDDEEINKPLADLLAEVSTLTVTEEAQAESFINPVKILLPRNTVNNLYRDYEKEKLNTTDFTKQRKQLLLKVVSEIITEFKPIDNYEVKISS